jgi:hypothetical protein
MRRIYAGISAFLQSPIGVVLGLFALWHLALWVLKIPIHIIPSVLSLIVDIVAVAVLQDRWTYFFSQFVLPVQTREERQEIFHRVRSGPHGPALFIKNGEVVASHGEEKKRGSGVILIDTASAAVLRTDTEICRTIGPGITFTGEGEYIAGTVDLRLQLQTMGPIPGDDPFAASTDFNKHYLEVQNRRRETSGLTRDGFEVVPIISVKFSVQRPGQDELESENRVNSRFGFNPLAVEKAIVRKVVQVGEGGNAATDLPWNQLPMHLTINLWREYVRKFKFSELFTSENTNGLQTIEDMINQRMKQLRVVELDDAGTETWKYLPSPEALHLFERGIQVEQVKIHCLYFEPSLEEKIVQSWETNWLSNAKKEKKKLEEWDALVETSAREEAMKHFADLACRPFLGKTRISSNPFITLQILFMNLKDEVVKENAASNQMEEELRKMEDFSKWLKDNNAINSTAKGGEPK